MTPLTQIKLLSFKDNFKELVNLSLRNKLPNKLIFSGNKGIGKSTFAFHLINYLFSQDEEGSYNLEDNEININNKSYKLVSNKTHPNLSKHVQISGKPATNSLVAFLQGVPNWQVKSYHVWIGSLH